MRGKLLITALVATTFVGYVECWKAEGHVLIARIAYDILKSENPQALTKANSILKSLAVDNPTLTKKEDKYPFVECSTLADDIRMAGGQYQEGWHFVDNPFVDSGSISDYPKFKFSDKNITRVIPELVNWLTNTGDYQDSYTYTTIMPHYKNTESLGRSMALRLLIHYVGDVHQPLHTESRVDGDFPTGDRGGNSFPLPNHYSANNLHSVWDSVMYEFHESMKLPFTPAGWNEVEGYTTDLLAKHKAEIKQSEITNEDATHWADESFAIAKKAYTGITQDEHLPQAYVDDNKTLLEVQIVTGGLRLAHLMTKIFGASKAIESVITNLFLQ